MDLDQEEKQTQDVRLVAMTVSGEDFRNARHFVFFLDLAPAT
jgi:hypothetical protein